MSKPWDARIAAWMVRPLRDTLVTPNHLTTVRLAVGLGAVAAFAHPGYGWGNLGAFLFALSNLIDHTDGELARLTGKTSRIGHFYDLACDALIHILVFAAIGVGLRFSSLGSAAPWMGLAAGAAISLIFYLRLVIEERLGKAQSKLPSAGGFEIEDILYLTPLVTLADGLQPFIVAASIGAPVFALWVIHDWLRLPSPEAATLE